MTNSIEVTAMGSARPSNREELKSLIEAIKMHKNKCLRNAVVLDSLQDTIGRSKKRYVSAGNEDMLPTTVSCKVARLLCSERLGGVVGSGGETDGDAFNLLGLSSELASDGEVCFLPLEKQLVRSAVEQGLLRRQRHPPKKFAVGAAADGPSSNKGMVKERDVSGLVLRNHAALQSHWEELMRLLDMRRRVVHEVLPQKVACLERQLSICHAQKRCLDAALLYIILTEVPKYSKALKLIYMQLKKGNDELLLEIDRLKNLRVEYQKLKGTKFDVLLLNYKTVLREIQHANWGLQGLRSY